MSKERDKIIKQLDDAWSEYVRLRDGKCVTCGSEESLGNGHLFTRTNYSTRWDEINCNAQCWPCNYKHEHQPYPYTRWFIGKYGLDAYDELYAKHHQSTRLKEHHLQDMLDEVKNKIAQLKKST